MTGLRYFTATDWKTAGIAFFAVLTLYVYTLAPTVTLEYSGALVVAADHLGVARPPGYPVWTLLAKGFICLFPFAEYQGHPNPAWAVNFMSAFFGALACGVLALLVSCESKHLFPKKSDAQQNPGRIGAVAGIVAALLFALSPAMWSQAVIAETHTLTNFYMLALLALSLRWSSTGGMKMAYVLAFSFGLGLTVSPLLILFAPILLLAAAFVSVKMWLRMAFAVILFLGFIVAEYIWGKFNPSVAGLGLYAILETTLLLVVFRRTRPTGILLALLLAGLLPILYIPLAAAHNPPINMGQANTWVGFWHVLGRGQYEILVPVNPFMDPISFGHQLAWYARQAAAEFTAPISCLALIPLLSLPWLNQQARKSIALLSLTFFLFSIVVLIGMNPQLDIQNTFICRVTFIPSFAVLALLIGLGLVRLIHTIMGKNSGVRGQETGEDEVRGRRSDVRRKQESE